MCSNDNSKLMVTCDSTCDLGEELYERFGIRPLPLGTALGDDLRLDGVNVDPMEIFDYVKKSGNLPKTSAVSISEYEEAFKEYLEQGMSVIHINISSEFSACYQNACIAASELSEEYSGKVYPIDSRNLSSGSGHLAIMARELEASGMAISDIVSALESAKERLDVSFVLQTLEYLQKGGRCSGVVALGANILKLRPEIVVAYGKMEVGRKYRGSAEKTILEYVRGRLEGRTDVDTRRIFITHSHADPEIVSKVRSLIKELQPFEDENIIETYAGCTVSCHCGPDCLGVLFFKK